MAKANPARAERIRRKAIDVRECLFEIVSNLAGKREISKEVIQNWNRIVSESQSRYEMVPDNQHGLTWRIRSKTYGLDAPLWPVIHSAIQLLTGPNASRIRKCHGQNCNWIFLDTSRRGNRRWCDMTVCGNRAKARSFYERKKKKGNSKQ
jgi:predicted RNA-binding Zn ribbon-like protein